MQDSFQGFDTFFTSGPNVIGMRQNFISYMFRVSTTQLNNDYMAALGFFFVCLLIEFANDMNVFDIFNHIFHCCLKPICCFTLNHGKRRVALSPVQLRQSQQLCTVLWTLSLYFRRPYFFFRRWFVSEQGPLGTSFARERCAGHKSTTFCPSRRRSFALSHAISIGGSRDES